MDLLHSASTFIVKYIKESSWFKGLSCIKPVRNTKRNDRLINVAIYYIDGDFSPDYTMHAQCKLFPLIFWV